MLAAPVETGNAERCFAVDLDMELLHRRWRAAIRTGETLPPYEDVALGELGRLNDGIALIRQRAPGAFELVRAGTNFERWLGAPTRNAPIAALRPDCELSLSGLIETALYTGKPARTTAHRVVAGVVETHDLMALPLASRWGGPVLMVFLAARDHRFSLVETIFEATDEGMLALSPVRDRDGTVDDFQIIALNDGAARLLDTERTAVQWKRLSALDGRLDRRLADKEISGAFMQALQQNERRTLEVTAKADRTRHFSIGIVPLGDLLSVTLTDIGEIKAREESFRLLFEGNPVPMWLFEPDTLRIRQVNDAAVAHYGYSRERFLEMSLPDLGPEGEWQRTGCTVADLMAEGATWTHIKANGDPIDVSSYLRELTIDGNPAILAAVIDVTERRKAEARVAHMAHHDALTGLPNRVLFRDRLVEALAGVRRRGENLAVLFLDLDHFKSVNDTLGHPVGDRLLQAVADRFRECLREDDIVARLGGDEFAIIQPAIAGPAEASRFATRLIESISMPYEIDGNQVVIGASVGVAVAPENGHEPDLLLKLADMALYRAKADGRNTFRFFEHEMDARLQGRRLLELDLRKALAGDEFELHYQPLVNLVSQEVSGFEALLRWNHPTRGMVSPVDFIPLAEDIGLIAQIGEWALRKACTEAAGWPDHLKVAVNLSPVQFHNRNLVAAVTEALAESGLNPDRLELEITESVLLQESESNLATLHQFRALGVRISMDDFGTGYSSLGYLQKFPFDKIKIDRSFIQGLSLQPEAAAIVRAVTGLGASLGISTTAEGVETEEQLRQLRAEGCTEVQGFLFSRPRPASELAPLLLRQVMVAMAQTESGPARKRA